MSQPKKLITVTVTGADDSITPHDLLELQARYPFAEFGILLGNEYSGRNRFPSLKWLDQLAEMAFYHSELRLSGHLCGQAVKEFMMGVHPNVDFLLDPFDRIQINTHGVKHEWTPDLPNLIREFNLNGKQIIFQYDTANSEALAACYTRGLDIAALYDLSHGAGVVPEQWTKPSGPAGAALDDLFCGYAGGLSPENVAAHLAGISKAAGDDLYWIDAETRLRSRQDGRDIFDLQRVVMFLEATRPWLVEERSCRVCGCTEANCSGCVERTGHPCHWVEPDLCSACAG